MKTINKDVSGREKDYQMDLFSSDGLESVTCHYVTIISPLVYKYTIKTT